MTAQSSSSSFARKIVINLVKAAAFYIAFIALFALVVRWYTQHGKYLQVPSLIGKPVSDAIQIVQNHNLKWVVSDSMYNEDFPPLTVLAQNPKPLAWVKKHRTIYLTVNATMPPSVFLPDLQDVPLKQAASILKSYGLKLGQLTYKADLARDVVLEVKANGRILTPGTAVKKGTRIDLVLGDGLGKTNVPVPDLLGLSLREVRFVLEGSGLQLGAVIADGSVSGDSLNAVVYKQIPPPSPSSTINAGEGIDVFVTSPNNYAPE